MWINEAKNSEKFQNLVSGIFDPPVRITECGHNYCENCLTTHADGNKDWLCPESRQQHQKNPNQLTRNYFVEKAVESFILSKNKSQTDDDVTFCVRHPTRQIEFG